MPGGREEKNLSIGDMYHRLSIEATSGRPPVSVAPPCQVRCTWRALCGAKSSSRLRLILCCSLALVISLSSGGKAPSSRAATAPHKRLRAPSCFGFGRVPWLGLRGFVQRTGSWSNGGKPCHAGNSRGTRGAPHGLADRLASRNTLPRKYARAHRAHGGVARRRTLRPRATSGLVRLVRLRHSESACEITACVGESRVRSVALSFRTGIPPGRP